MTKVPFNDLRRVMEPIEKELEAAFKRVYRGGRFIKGAETRLFEESFARYVGASHCVGCGNGTDALEIILKAMEIGEGDEVIVPVNTCAATAEAVVNAGARPVFADVDCNDHTITAPAIAEKITQRTKAAIPVHLYGYPADMDPIIHLCREHKIAVVEDCAQAHGAAYKGRKAGSLGAAAAFSFYPTKNLGALGDAGAIVVNDDKLAEKMRMIADHGQRSRDVHIIPGVNSRMDELQAAFLNVKLLWLDEWNEQRAELARYYIEKLKGTHVVPPRIPDDGRHAFHLFVIQTEKRDRLLSYLSQNGIDAMIHYSYLVPRLEAFRKYADNDAWPNAEYLNARILSLPFFPGMSREEVDRVCEAIAGAGL